jgi:predicted kinase
MPATHSPARLLLITGAPGSGKTQLARALVARYGWRLASKDEIKETLFEALGTGDAAWSRRLSDASFALLFRWAPRLLGAHGLLLLEGNFRAGEHEPPLRSVLEASATEMLQVLCVAAPATRAARLAARGDDPGRHRGHRDAQFDVNAADRAGFLELPGARLRFNSEADWEGEFAGCCTELDRWVCAPKV